MAVFPLPALAYFIIAEDFVFARRQQCHQLGALANRSAWTFRRTFK
jgi:hypothetical protein